MRVGAVLIEVVLFWGDLGWRGLGGSSDAGAFSDAGKEAVDNGTEDLS